MQDREECVNEIHLLEYIHILVRKKKLILAIVVVSVTATVIISFLSPKIYEARAVIMPSTQPQEQSSMNTVASQLGLLSAQTSNASEIISLLQSTILMERVIKTYNLLPIFFGKDAAGQKPVKKIWDGIRYLKKRIYKVRDNKRDGIIEISVQFKDPEVSAKIVTYILAELTDYMSGEAKRVAETNRKYLESLIDKNADPLIKQKIYSLIARQLEISMMAEVKENFAFKILDPPKVPDRKIKPAIGANSILSFVLSLFAAIFIALLMEYIGKSKDRQQRYKKKEGRG